MRLDDFIRNNYESFNNEEPPAGHCERFERRLRRKKLPIFLIVNFAAAALLAGLAIGLIFFRNENSDIMENCVVSGEMREAQEYYRSVLRADTEHLEKLLENVEQDDVRTEIMHELKEINRETTTFCNSAENGIAAMVTYYRSKIEAVEMISKIFEIKNI